MIIRRVCVFCGSNSGLRTAYTLAARSMGRLLAGRGIGLVYGGGRVGLMGELATTVMAEGGEVIGVIPRALLAREVGHRGISELRIVGSMHERKAAMVELSDAFVALPGGFGTFEEFFEVITWAQLGLHAKPCGILNVERYYDALLDLLGAGMREGFIHPSNQTLVLQSTEPEALLDMLAAYQAPAVEKWIDNAES